MRRCFALIDDAEFALADAELHTEGFKGTHKFYLDMLKKTCRLDHQSWLQLRFPRPQLLPGCLVSLLPEPQVFAA